MRNRKIINPAPSYGILNSAGRTTGISIYPRSKSRSIPGRCWIKVISGVLIFAQIFWALPFLADAQLSVCGATPLNPCFTNDSNNGNSFGTTGNVANAAALATLSAAFATYQGSLTTVQGVETANHAAQLGLNAGSLLTNNTPLVTVMIKVMAAYTVFLTTARAQLLIINNVPAPNIYIANLKQQYSTQMSNTIQIYAARADDMQARLNTAQQSFWKTLLISMLLQTSKAVADTLVTKLVNNYKISNFKQYADSAATLMYDNQFIRQNFPDNQDQLMARAILNNPLLRTQIQPGIFVAADAALGFNPSAINPASANFYGQMAALGSPSANPYYLQTAYVGNLDQSRAASMATAQQQISQGSGYKAPVNCAGSLNQQKLIDAQSLALQNQLQNRTALLLNLTDAVKAGQNVPAADLTKAQSDYESARTAWLNAPQAVTSSSGSTSTNVAIVMCEAISSPAVLVNQGIDSLFNSLSNGALAQYNSNNLPAYINMISGVASQIGTSMVLGGAKAGATSALINENQVVTGTVGLVNQMNAAANSAAVKMSDNVVTGVYPGSGNSSLINWQVITANLANPSYVTLTGPGAPTTHLPLTGNTTVSPASDTSYILNIFNAAGKNLGSANINVYISSQQSYNYNPNAPAVAGAFTQHYFQSPESSAGFTAHPAIQTRGPALEISIR